MDKQKKIVAVASALLMSTTQAMANGFVEDNDTIITNITLKEVKVTGALSGKFSAYNQQKNSLGVVNVVLY